MYGGSVDAAVSPVLVFATADILGIRRLFDQALAQIREESELHAGRFCLDLVTLPLSDHMARIKADLIKHISRNFTKYVDDEQVLQLPEDIIHDILASDDLQVDSEDEVVDFLFAYYALDQPARKRLRRREPVQNVPAGESARDLVASGTSTSGHAIRPPWRACRLAFASFPCLLSLRSSLAARAGAGALLHLVESAGFYRSFLQTASPMCTKSPYTEFAKSYAECNSLTPRRPAHIPLADGNEIDFVVHVQPNDVWEANEVVLSAPKHVDGMCVKLMVYPQGEQAAADRCVSIFLKATPVVNSVGENWSITARFDISLFHWAKQTHERCGKRAGQVATCTFRSALPNRGWPKFLKHGDVPLYVNQHGFLYVRGRIVRVPDGPVEV